jgi:multimeric flavodoxin WrbA
VSLVILDAFTQENAIEKALKNLLEKTGKRFFYFKLNEMKILPCRSCGACEIKSPGKCVFHDDMPEIMRAIAPGSLILMLTPVRFGGYSSQLKKVLDKLMILVLPLYTVKDGHLLHPPRYGKKSLLIIGLTGENLPGEEENFRLLAARNALNLQFTHKTLLFAPTDPMAKIEEEIEGALCEVRPG